MKNVHCQRVRGPPALSVVQRAVFRTDLLEIPASVVWRWALWKIMRTNEFMWVGPHEWPYTYKEMERPKLVPPLSHQGTLPCYGTAS